MKIKMVDTLHFGLEIEDYYNKSKKLLEELAYLKELGQETRVARQIRLADTLLTVELSGARFYSYRLICKDFTLLFAEKPSDNNPPVKVNFSSEYLWSYGYEAAYQYFIKWFEKATNLKVIESKITRIDICVDTDEAEFYQNDIHGIVTYSKSKSQHFANDVDDINYSGRQFTGITIGRGKSILCRIYDKSREIKKSGKEWFKDIWHDNGYDSSKTVWRVEFQLRRKVLKEFNINTVEETFHNIDSLWDYLTMDWLNIRIPRKDTKVTNWKISKKWALIQSATTYNAPKIIRRRVKEGNIEKLKAQAGGLLISITAKSSDKLEGIDYTLEILKRYLIEKLHKKGKTFSGEVYMRKGQYMGGLNIANVCLA